MAGFLSLSFHARTSNLQHINNSVSCQLLKPTAGLGPFNWSFVCFLFQSPTVNLHIHFSIQNFTELTYIHSPTFPTDPFCCLVGTEPVSTVDLHDDTRRGRKICDAPAKPLNLHQSFLLFLKSTLKITKMFAVTGHSCLNNQIHLYAKQL